MYESNTASMCKSNGKDTIYTLATRMAGERHGRGMGAAWELHGMCELAFDITIEM
jgi:hypothetical protein